MKIVQRHQAIHADKSEGISVDYYIFPEYEIHYNEQLPNSTQTWHHHATISETLFIIEGELTAQWKEDDKTHTTIIKAGDLVETQNTPHTFTNHTNQTVKFLVFKQVLSGENKREILKNDKIIDQ